jgi:colanic acid/amylovoran biosynthesis protein
MHNTVIFNVYGHLNSGDALLLEALLDTLAKKRPKDHVSGIAFDVDSERKWQPEMPWYERIGNTTGAGISGRFRQVISLVAIIGLASSHLLFFLRWILPKSQREAVEALAHADLAISCPGGYLEDSNSAYILNLLQIFIACQYSRHVILAPQSIGPIKSRFGRFLTAKAIRAVDKVFVREPWSQEFLEELLDFRTNPGLQNKIEQVGDLAFWFDSVEDTNTEFEFERLGIDATRPILGLTVVNWNFPHYQDSVAKKQNYLDALSMLVEHVHKKHAHQIVVFNQVNSDLKLGRQLGERHHFVIIDDFERGTATFCHLIGLCDVFVGTRFHSCIFALLGSVPTAAIAYLPKTTGIMQDMGMSDCVMDIDSVKGEDLIAMFERLLANRAEISRRVSACVQQYRQTHSGFIDYLTDGIPTSGVRNS